MCVCLFVGAHERAVFLDLLRVGVQEADAVESDEGVDRSGGKAHPHEDRAEGRAARAVSEAPACGRLFFVSTRAPHRRNPCQRFETCGEFEGEPSGFRRMDAKSSGPGYWSKQEDCAVRGARTTERKTSGAASQRLRAVLTNLTRRPRPHGRLVRVRKDPLKDRIDARLVRARYGGCETGSRDWHGARARCYRNLWRPSSFQ